MSTDDDSEDDYFQYNNWHNGMKDNNCALCSAPGNGNDDNSDVNSGPVGRAKSELTTTEAGIEIDSLGVDYAKYDEIPVTKRMLAGVLDTDEHLVTRVSMITAEVSRVDTSSYSNDSPGIQECVCPEHGKRDDLSAHMDLQLWVKYGQRNMTVRCFGLCGISDRLNRPESDWCWDCVDRLVWGYRVSCVVTIVTKSRSLGIDVFIEEHCVYASTRGVGDGPIRAYDVIPVYVWMKENFKDGLNKVMLMNKAPVDSRYHQRGGDNRQVRRTRASVDNRPIRVWGRFGCLYSPVHGADWLDVLPVGGSRVGKDVWIGYIGDGFSQCQSPDAAPLTELRDLNTLLHIYSDCATRLYLIWTVSITVRISLGVEEVTRCCGDLDWCTTWKGSPQDYLEHVRSGHDAPWVSKTASIEKYAPPWTVRRQLWTDSLRIEHSGISTDMLLFSEVGMPLTQHYHVYKGGLPHAVFRTDYMARLRSLLPSPGGTDTPPENVCGVTPKSVRRPHRLSQPKRLFPETVVKVPILTEQNPAEMIWEMVIDCRPSLLPVSIPLSGLSPETISGARNCVSYQPSEETGQSIMNMDTSEISINRIVGFVWDEGGTNVEDELPTPASSPNQIVVPAIPPAGTADPFGRGESFDLELAKVICEVSVLPSLVSPLQEVEVSSCATAADYAPPAAPPVESVLESPRYTVPDDLGCSWMPDFVPGSEVISTDEGGYLRSLQEPLPLLLAVASPTAPMVAESDPPSAPRNSCETERTPVTMGSPAAAECVVTDDAGPDLSREGPFDTCDADHEPGQSPMVLDSMSGCQYRMTSYEERANRDDLDPSHGIHLHDPRMMEYMGAPESARLLGRTPEYWLEHMGREWTIQAALRLHHDASLIMTNIQIMSQLVTSFSRTASEVMRTVYDREPFPTSAVDFVTPGRRVRPCGPLHGRYGLVETNQCSGLSRPHLGLVVQLVYGV